MIGQAHESGDLADFSTLMQAMMYRNYLDSPVEVREILEKDSAFQGLDAKSPSPGYSDPQSPLHEKFPAGPTYRPNQIVRHVTKASSYLKNATITLTTEKELRDPGLPPERRVELFTTHVLNPQFSRQAKSRRAWLYLSDAPCSLIRLVEHLGLYHYRIIDPEVPIFRLTFEAAECRKPHWGDAGLAFNFLQTSVDVPHGWTLSLRTGRATFPELIHENIQELTLTNVLLDAVDGTYDLSSPSNSYWNTQKTRIEGGRD